MTSYDTFFSQDFFSKSIAAEFIFKVEEPFFLLYIVFNLVGGRFFQDVVRFKKIAM